MYIYISLFLMINLFILCWLYADFLHVLILTKMGLKSTETDYLFNH